MSIIMSCIIMIMVTTILIGYFAFRSKIANFKQQQQTDQNKIASLQKQVETLQAENKIYTRENTPCEVWKQVFVQELFSTKQNYYMIVRDTNQKDSDSYFLSVEPDLWRDVTANENFFIHLETTLSAYHKEILAGNVKAIRKEVDYTLSNVCK